MKLNLPTKRAAITVAAVILVAGVVAGRERPAVEILQPRAAAVTADDGIDLDKLRQRGELSPLQSDPFAVMNSGAKAPAAAAQASAPEKPVAPPLPFQYVGKWSRGDKTEVLVMHGEELLPIDPGQKLGDYRVEQIDESSISFTYLPLKMKQTLDVASAVSARPEEANAGTELEVGRGETAAPLPQASQPVEKSVPETPQPPAKP
jgi:hypothetical protein